MPTLSHEQFMRLFLQSEREILRYVMAIVPNVADARDILQETALALWKAIDKYDPERPFIPWACRFALNETRMFLRTDGRRKRFIREDLVAMLEARRFEIAPQLDTRREHLRECLDQLPADQRSLIRGYYFDDDTVPGLAERLGRSVEAVYKSLQRIRQALEACIDSKAQLEAAGPNS
ncbi:MAG: sigma-70 family RNA polymerase sigma factor [Planctomycetia bacterium]|nr:sigma-70 family RNA polymerase sigma factor [Planctomycetia bacterium]